MKVFFVLFGSFLLIVGVGFFSAPLWPHLTGIPVKGNAVEAYLFVSVLGCIGCGLGALIIVSVMTGHIDLYPDAIVVGSALPFGKRRLKRNAIGAKLVTFAYLPMYILYPLQNDQKKLTVSVWRQDEYFREWMAGIPDANKEFFQKRRRGELSGLV